MRSRATYLFLLFFTLLISGFSSESNAQSSLGVVWDIPENRSAIEQQLSVFEDLGITHIEVEHPIQANALPILEASGFTFYVNASVPFLTKSELTDIKPSLLESYLSLASEYQNYPSIGWMALLSDSQMYDEEFATNFRSILGSVQENSGLSFYYLQGHQRISFGDTEQSFGTSFVDTEFSIADLNAFDAQFAETIATNSNQVLFVNSEWLFQAIEDYPALRESMVTYSETGEWLFPNPEADQRSGISFHWIIVVLLVLWGLLAIQFRYLPYVRPMILRYFFAHRFYVDDIIQYRERNAVAGISLIFSHALFGGIVFYILGNVLFSTNGLESLFHHLPFLSLFGESYMSLFFTGSLIVFGLEILALLWLHLPAKNLQHISQTINLYSGIFFLDYLLVTVMVTLFVQEASFANSLLTLSIIYTVIWYASFTLTAINASQTMGGRRVIYLVLTVGLHTLISAFFLFLILSTDSLMEILHLSISI